MLQYHLTRIARTDLDAIWDYIANDNPNAANKLLATFEERFLMLVRQPLIGEPRNEVQAGLRSFSVGNYVIYYRFDHNEVAILRVLHGARGIESQF